MSSRTGFTRADVDVGLFSDPKVGRLLRIQGNDFQRTALTMFLFTATILASWKADESLTLTEAAPLWYLADQSLLDQMASDLHQAGLLDADERIPRSTLDSWMASVRGSSQRASGAARRRWNADRTTDRTAVALPSQPASPPETGARAREDQSPPLPFGELMRQMGLNGPAIGLPDEQQPEETHT